MVSSASKWWQTPDDADLDYGFDSDDLDARFAEPARLPHRPRTREELEQLEAQAQAQAQARTRTREQDTGEKGVFGNMSSWLHRQAGSQSSQLATTAVLSGAAVAGAIFGYQAYKRKEAVHDLKASIPVLDDEHPAAKVSSDEGDF
jgi:uncharacterized membrane protein YebE (DUF533 family)